MIDTWRLLCARRLFWITLGITALIGIAYASIGFHEKGFSLGYSVSFENPILRRGSPESESLYLWLFYQLVWWWTTFFGVILALVSCSSIFPEFMASGAIDTVLSKPISRHKLFLYKFVSGLLFAATQIALLAVLVYLAIRWRLGFWHHAVFWSVPYGILLYSYLYAINVLIGVWTRSVLASLLLTLLAWAGLAFLQITENVLGEFSRTSALEAFTGTPAKETPEAGPNRWAMAHRVVVLAMAVLPKTSETTDVIRRQVMREDDKSVQREQDIQKSVEARIQLESMTSRDGRRRTTPEAARQQAEKDMDAIRALEKSPWYIVGTSLAFEAAVLGLACWVFARSDY
jgi:hypothetical protein